MESENVRAANGYVFSPGKAWTSVGILMIFSLVAIMDRQIIALLVQPIKSDLGLSDTQIGLLQGVAFGLTYAIAGLPIGWAVDRYPRRIIVYIGITIWSISAAACGLARNFWELFIGRSGVGAGEATVAPVAVSLISDIFPPDKVGAPMGVYAAGHPLGSGVSLLLGGLVIGLFAGQDYVDVAFLGTISTWQAVFIIVGLPGALIAFLAFALLEPPRNPFKTARTQAADTMTVRDYVAQRGAVVVLTFAGFMFTATVTYAVAGWTPAFMGRSFGWTPQQIGPAFGLVTALAGIGSNMIAGQLVDRIYKTGRTDACLIVAAGCAGFSMPFLIAAYFMTDPFWVLACLGTGMLIFAGTGACSYATWQIIAPPQLRGRVTAAFVLVSALGGTSLGPAAIGLVTDYVYKSEALVGHSIATVIGVFSPMTVILLLLARGALRRVQ